MGDVCRMAGRRDLITLVLCSGLLGSLVGSRVRAEEVPPRILYQPSDVVVKVGFPATLTCRAEGNPEPAIEWLRNGQRLETFSRDDQSQLMVLSDGSLFFLSVGGGRRGQTHEGVYTCVATNSAGKATSRNASLYIAVLREEFTVQPSDVEVAEGEEAVLNCRPPLGHPEPNVTWRKDGLLINSKDTHYTELSGKLIIGPSEKKYSGVYVCVATNTAGVRESRAARLSVLAKPVLRLKPEDMAVRTGESAHFHCQAEGDPPPAVVWSREQGPLPNGRYLVSPDQSLQIHYVTVQDAGQYTCTAVNDIGVVAASAQLLVEDAANTKQIDLHKELSTLRVALDNITVTASASNVSQVQWKLQSLPAQPHYLDGFEVLYRSLLPAISEWTAKRVPLPNFQTSVGPLKRGYKYEFKVRPYGSSLYGRESNTRHLRVPEITPSSSPLAVGVTVQPENNNTVHLSWEPPPFDAHNGILQGYQVWCVETKDGQSHNWTVDSGRHSLDISTLAAGKRYSVAVAAVNGAGLGKQSEPLGFSIDSEKHEPPHSDGPGQGPSRVLAVLRDPLLISSACALLWCVLTVAGICLYRRHTRTGLLSHRKAKGLHRLAGEDLIIKHRMAAPDSPWISGAWRPMHCNEFYQGLWAQSQGNPAVKGSSLPIMAKKDPSFLDSAVPVVPDSCGVYGTFYVDLVGNSLKTFNSPGRRPKMPHGPPQLQGVETICIAAHPVSRPTAASAAGEALPWKQAVPPRPKMGVLRESWEKNHNKHELHSVKSVPLLPASNRNNQRFSHRAARPPGVHPDSVRLPASPRVLHYSASLHLVDMLPPPPPPPPIEDTTDTHSLTSDEGSSRSTKLTVDVDMGSLQSVCAATGCHQYPGPPDSNPTVGQSSYSHHSTASYHPSLDDDQGAALTSQDVTQYLELNSKAENHSNLPKPPLHPARSLTPTLGYLCSPLPSDPQGVHQRPEARPEARPAGLRRSWLRSTPSSCYSEWEGSLWSTWSSVTEGSMASARTSLISSVDGSSVGDPNFARFLTLAAAGSSGTSCSDFSPPASPLSVLLPPFDPSAGSESEPAPAWEWNMAWLEEMEARYRAQYPGHGTLPYDA